MLKFAALGMNTEQKQRSSFDLNNKKKQKNKVCEAVCNQENTKTPKQEIKCVCAEKMEGK